ncbi:MAG: hypothetical protein OCD76_12715 [Reichenbachiella sp.]
MIVSKPKINTLFSVSIFIVLAFAFSIYSFITIFNGNDQFLWKMLAFGSGTIGVTVVVKILLGLKSLKVRKEKFEINMPCKFKKIRFTGKDINKWTHSAIKTYGGQYEELIWELSSGKKINISKQENTEFDKVLRYMKKKYSKLEVS